MIREKDFGSISEGEWLFTLKRLYDITDGEGGAWDAYFDPEGMDVNVRHLFENALHPASRTVAVMLRSFLKKLEKR